MYLEMGSLEKDFDLFTDPSHDAVSLFKKELNLPENGSFLGFVGQISEKNSG